MGTDIHGVFQKRTTDGWEDVTSTWEQNRHYFLFSVLAGVRNGYGFAGVPTYDPVIPISEPRGLPADYAVHGEEHPVAALEILGRRAEWHGEDEPLELWMGDHSHSWLSADEILAYADQYAAQLARRTGVIPREVYNQWDKTSQPADWSGDVWGADIVVSNPAEIGPKTTHVRVSWVVSALEQISEFIEEVRRLKTEHGDVRLVFGFDS